MTRLRRTHPGQPGYTRHRRGRGWQFLDADGATIGDKETIERIRSLAIPPAWQQIWITPYPNGHLQAVGTDAAGRRQYLYHPDWSSNRQHRKFERVVVFGAALPAARRQVAEHLELPGMPRERALATAFRLLDRGHFRIGGEVYAETNGSFGLATLRREHVRDEAGRLVFDYPAKSGLHRVESISDPELLESVAAMRRRRGGPPELLVYQESGAWRNLTSADINDYLKQVVAPDISAKDFRTWHGTVLAAVALAGLRLAWPADRRRSHNRTTKTVRQAVRAVAERLGNTPAVCRASYIDPRVITAFEEDRTVSGAVTRASRQLARPAAVDEAAAAEVLSLLAGAPAVERAVLALLRS